MKRVAKAVRAKARVVAALASGVLLAAVLSFSLDAGASAQGRASVRGAPAKPHVSIRDKGRGIAFVERGRAHPLELGDKFGAARIEEAGLLFASSREGFTYLVIDVCGSSRYRSNDRQCGAGRECDLLWVKLDRRRKVVDAKSERYESCWLPITSEDGPKVVGQRLVLELENLREWVRKKVGYDADRPEEGLSFESFAIPKDTP